VVGYLQRLTNIRTLEQTNFRTLEQNKRTIELSNFRTKEQMGVKTLCRVECSISFFGREGL
jgi:hypothetical protein